MTHDVPRSSRVSFDLDAQGVGHVRLTRADKLNALDPAMFTDLVALGEALCNLPGLRCVVLAGEGRAFCAGLDLTSMALLTGPDAPDLRTRTHGSANLFQQAAMVWRQLPVPVVAAIHGVCFGGGLQLVSGSDIRVAAPDARLSVMEMKWGLVPDMAGFALWRSIVRDDVLRELTFTNREFSGAEAAAFGFATLCDADPLARACAIAAEIAARSPSAMRAAKTLLNSHRDMPIADVLMAESTAQRDLLGSRDQLEAVAAQMEGRAADFAGR